MTICLGKSCFCKLLSIYVFIYFPFGSEGRIWDLIVSVPYHCLSFYFVRETESKLPHDKTNKMTVRPLKTQISLRLRLV